MELIVYLCVYVCVKEIIISFAKKVISKRKSGRKEEGKVIYFAHRQHLQPYLHLHKKSIDVVFI